MRKNILSSLTIIAFLLFLNVSFSQTLELGVLSSFETFAGVGAVTNGGTSSGNAGTNTGIISGSGFDSANGYTGTLYNNDDTTIQARIDLLRVYIHLDDIFVTYPSKHAPAFGGGETITPGIYSIGGAGSIAGALTLDGGGDSNAVFIMKFEGAFTVGVGSTITLTGGARAANVFWISQGAISIGSSSTIKGTLFAHPGAVTLGANSNIEGRLFTSEGAITIAAGGTAVMPVGPITVPIQCLGDCISVPVLDVLRSLKKYALFTSNGAVANAATSGVVGNIGTNLGAISGFGTSTHVGYTYHPGAETAKAVLDLDSAYNDLITLPNTELGHTPAFGSGETVYTGVYYIGGAGSLAGTIILDGQNNPNSIFVFKFNGAFSVAAQSRVILINGASRCNVFWISEGAADMGTFTYMKGTVLAHGGACSMGANGSMEGRMLSTGGAIGFSTGVVYNDGLCFGDDTPIPGPDQTVCSDGTTTQAITATAKANTTNGTIIWYDAATGGSVVSNPTQTGLGTKTYYAESFNGTYSSTARVSVTLIIEFCSVGPNPPTITHPNIRVPEDSSVVFCPTLSDSDLPNDSLFISSCNIQKHGTLKVIGDSCFEYKPDFKFVGLDSLCLIVCDTFGLCDTTLISITVTPVIDTLVKVIPEDSTLVVCPPESSNVNTITGLSLSCGPSHGATVLSSSTGCVTYVPDSNYIGNDAICIVICDSIAGVCDTTVVLISVTPVIDTLIKVILEDSTLIVCPPESSNVNTITGLSLSCGPSHGTTVLSSKTGCITYVPDSNYVGNDAICIVICNQIAGVCDTTVVLISVTPVIDTLIKVIPKDSTLVVCPPELSNVNTITGLSLSCGPSNGTIVLSSSTGCVTYVPDSNYVGNDAICIVICDSIAGVCDTTVVLISVTPVIDTLIKVIPEDSTLVVCPPESSRVDSITSVSLLCGPSHGTTVLSSKTTSLPGPSHGTTILFSTTGCVTYEPDSNYVGNDTICIVICDNIAGLCDTTVTIITVIPVIDTLLDTTCYTCPVTWCPPTISSMDSVASFSDCGSNGTMTLDPTTSCVTYLPNIGFFGDDTTCFILCNPQGVCDTTVLIVKVDFPLTIDTIFTRDKIVCLDTLEIIRYNTVSTCDGLGLTRNGGAVSLLADGCVKLSPNFGTGITDTTCMIICDTLTSQCDTTIIVSLKSTTRDTIAVQLNYSNLGDTCLAQNELLGSTFRYYSCARPVHGILLDYNDTCLTYTQTSGVKYLDTACIIICDEYRFCDTTVLIFVPSPESDTLFVQTVPVSSADTCVSLESTFMSGHTTSTCSGTGTSFSGIPLTITGLCISYPVPGAIFTGDTACIVVCDTIHGLMICDTTMIVYVPDTLPPTVICKNETVYLDNLGGVMIDTSNVTWLISDNTLINSVWLSNTWFNCSNVGLNNVTLYAQDTNRNIDSCIATIIVLDTISPTVVCQNITITLDSNGNVSIVALDVDGGSSDNCTITSMRLSDSVFSCADVGVNPVTLTVTDASGNVGTCMTYITVLDTTSPIVSCKKITVYLDASGVTTIDPAYIDNGSTDNCITTSMAISKSSFNCSNIGANSVTLIVTEVSGNIDSCISIVTVSDTISPIASCKNVTAYLNSMGNATIDLTDIDNGSSDNCGIATIVLSATTFDCTNIGANSVALIVTDASGNIDSCISIVTVSDTISPIASCKNATAYLNSMGNATIDLTDIDNGSSDNCGIATIVLSATTFDCTNIGANSVTLIVTDASGNVDSCISIVTLLDTTSPIASCKNATVYLNSMGNATIDSTDIDNGSTDNCGIATIALSVTTFDCTNIGANTVTMTVTDQRGYTSICMASVTVVDLINPVVICKDTTIYLDSSNQVVIDSSFVFSSTFDNCGINSVWLSKSMFTCKDLGANSVVVYASDSSGNIDSCTSTVTVILLNQPIKDTIAIPVNSSNFAQICLTDNRLLGTPTSYSNCKNVTRGNLINYNDTCFTYTQTSSIKYLDTACVIVCDDCGICDTTVLIFVPSPESDTLFVQTVPVSSADTCVSLESTFMSGHTTSTCSGTGTSFSGIPLTITGLCISYPVPGAIFTGDTACIVVCDTIHGLMICDTTMIVYVPDTLPPTVICKNETVYLDNLGGVMIDTSNVTWLISDNTLINSVWLSNTWFNCSNVGLNNVTLYAQDTNRNIDSCIATIIVLDTISPTVVCQNITITLDSNGNVSIVALDVDGGSSDNCAISSVTIDNNTFDCSNIGQNTVTLTVTDVHGNVSTCLSIVTVEDQTAPLVFCPADQKRVVRNTRCTYLVEDFTGLATWDDNCDSSTVTVTQFPSAGTPVELENESVTITITTTDGSMNSSTCTFEVYARCVKELRITQFISPNGDGVNDTWEVPELADYSDNTVKVYNRWGNLVFEQKRYSGGWGGVANANGSKKSLGSGVLPEGTYFYIIDLGDDNFEPYIGYMQIKK